MHASASATRPNGMIWTNGYLVGLMSRIMKAEHSLALSQVSAKAKMSILLLFRNRNRKFEIATELFTPVVVANVEI